MMSDVCKHCVQAGCLEVCPTGAIIRTEFDTVVIQSDVCKRCRAASLPARSRSSNVTRVGHGAEMHAVLRPAHGGLEPAARKACPTDSISSDDHRAADRGRSAPTAQGAGRQGAAYTR